MSEKDKEVIKNIETEIQKIDKKESKIYFFVLDTKGNPSGMLEYIYKLALILKEEGYNVAMLYQVEENEEFVGVKEWLGEEYDKLPHQDISSENTSVSPCDILFIPEIFASVMTQTKQLPCKRVAILQNYNFITEQIPLSVQWGDLGIMDAIVNTKENEDLLRAIFPYVKTQLVEPYLDSKFYDDKSPKKLIINIVSRDPSYINRIIKPFYWANPLLKWVSFRDLRGFSKEEFAKYLRESAITIWIDDEASVGYSALEAMKSGSLVMAKIPDNKLDWVLNEHGELQNGCLWFDSIRQLPEMISQVVRAWITDSIPETIIEQGKKIADEYTKNRTKNEIVSYVENLLSTRKEQFNNLILNIKNKKQ